MKLELNVNRFANEDVIATSTVTVSMAGGALFTVTGSKEFGIGDYVYIDLTNDGKDNGKTYYVNYSYPNEKYYLESSKGAGMATGTGLTSNATLTSTDNATWTLETK